MSAEELAWLAYQIALCYTMLDDYKEAIRYCRICVKAAESENISCWAVSGYLLQATVAGELMEGPGEGCVFTIFNSFQDRNPVRTIAE